MQPIQPTSRPRALRRRLVAIVAATAAAAATAALGVVFAPPVAAATGDTHFFMDNRTGFPGPVDVFQSTRVPSGAFAARVDVTAQAGRLNEDAADIAAARVGTINHLVVARGADVLHTVQGANGAWSPFTTVATGRQSTILEIAAANVSGQLQVVVRTLGGAILHALRDAQGTWTPFGDIESQAGQLNVDFGPPSSTSRRPGSPTAGSRWSSTGTTRSCTRSAGSTAPGPPGRTWAARPAGRTVEPRSSP